MSEARCRQRRVMAANDNGRAPNLLGVILLVPQDLPIQHVEVEVFAELLDSLTIANNNDDGEP